MTDPADDPTCQRLRLAAAVLVPALRQIEASDTEIERELADLAREMEERNVHQDRDA
jgi:hypothetical protein